MYPSWEVSYRLNPVNAADAQRHDDTDPMSNLDEFNADTCPTNAISVLALTGILPEGNNVRIAWQGGVMATQFLERCDTLTANPVTWSIVFTHPPPTTTVTNRVDPTPSGSRHYYRIRAAR